MTAPQPEAPLAVSEEGIGSRLFLIERKHPRQIRFLLVPVAVPVYEYNLDGGLQILGQDIEREIEGDLPRLDARENHSDALIGLPDHVLFNRLDDLVPNLQDKMRPLFLVAPIELAGWDRASRVNLHKRVQHSVAVDLRGLQFPHLLIRRSRFSGDSLPVVVECRVFADAIHGHGTGQFHSLSAKPFFEKFVYRLILATLLDCCLDLRRRQGRPSGA